MPSSGVPGGPGFTLTVRGSGFVPASVVNWNGSPRPTTFATAGTLTAAIPASDIATAGTATVTVQNPSPGGGRSNPAYFEVTTPTSTVAMAAYDLPQVGAVRPTSLTPSTVAVGDFNGDGKLDIALLAGVLLGNGDGTFQSRIALPPRTDGKTFDSLVTATFAVADLNGDGKLDLIIETGPNFYVLLGNGDGSFQPPISLSVVAYGSGYDFLLGDFNGDGKPDLAVTGPVLPNGAGQTVSVFPGNGDGTFGAAVFSTTLPSAYSLASGDLNGDGKLDLGVCETGGQNTGPLAVFLGNGDGTLQPPRSTTTCGLVIAFADVNGDGKLDALTWGFLPPDPGYAAINLGNGDGTFQSSSVNQSLAAGLAALTDLNGDGFLDLVHFPQETHESTPRPPGLGVFLGNGNGFFQTESFVAANAGDPLHVAGSGDFNGDGKMDLLAVGTSTRGLWVLLQGLLPADTASPTTVSFGTQSVGIASAPQNVTLTNTGTAALTFSGISISGTDATMFSETNTCGVSVAAGANCQVQVIFSPTVAGARSAVLNVHDNGIGGPLALPLSGSTPTVSTVVLSSTSLSFTSQVAGKPSSAQTVPLTNGGGATLSNLSVSITGANAADFAQTNTCGSSVAIGAACEISVTFTSSTGSVTETAAVTIADSAADSPQTISLAGTTAQASALSLSPSSITFPSQFVGTSGLPQTVTVTNTGSARVNIASVTTTPSDFGNLSVCGSSLDVGQSCNIGVFFDPTAAGSRTGTLTVTDDAINGPQRIPLTGSGQDFSVGVSGAASATVTPGQTATYAIAFAPAGGFSQPIMLSCGGAPALSTCTVRPSSLQLSGASPVMATVTVTTTAKGFMPPFGTDTQKRVNYQLVPLILSLLGLLMAAGALWRREQPLRWASLFTLAVLLCLGMTLTSCGGGSSVASGGSVGTQAGTYTITVSGSFASGSTTLTHATDLTLVVQ